MRPSHLHLGSFVAVAAAVCVIVLGLHIAWVFAAALVMLACNVGGWMLERRQRRPDS